MSMQLCLVGVSGGFERLAEVNQCEDGKLKTGAKDDVSEGGMSVESPSTCTYEPEHGMDPAAKLAAHAKEIEGALKRAEAAGKEAAQTAMSENLKRSLVGNRAKRAAVEAARACSEKLTNSTIRRIEQRALRM